MKFIFLDRDGVINQRPIPGYIQRWEDFHFLENVFNGLKKVFNAGYSLAVITNQQGVGKKVMTMETLELIHQNMEDAFRKEGILLSGVYVCPHLSTDDCNCRKPKIGLFTKAMENFPISPNESFFIGDTKSDMIAGKNAGLRTILIKGEVSEEIPEEFRPLTICNDLNEAADFILRIQT